MNKFDEFKSLYRQFINGTRWLNEKRLAGHSTEQDIVDLKQSVIEPMDALWAGFTDEEKDDWLKVADAVRIFNGRIV